MSEKRVKKIVIPLAATIVIALALSVVAIFSSPATSASAQLQCNPDTNPAGNEPPGQQACTCEGLPQDCDFVNPSGNAPPGKNK